MKSCSLSLGANQEQDELMAQPAFFQQFML